MDDFERFWSLYPIKVSKGAARKAFSKAQRLGATITILLAALDAQKFERTKLKAQNKFVPDWKHPATWLNGECWLDSPAEPEKQQTPKAITTCKIPHCPKPWTIDGMCRPHYEEVEHLANLKKACK